jgi:hypothetical protein
MRLRDVAQRRKPRAGLQPEIADLERDALSELLIQRAPVARMQNHTFEQAGALVLIDPIHYHNNKANEYN